MKPLLVGEAPSKNEPLPKPLEGRSGRRLAECCGLTMEQFLERFDRVNLLDVRQDTREKGFEFDRVAAIDKAREILERLEPGREVILLGRRVADAFGVITDWFGCTQLPNGTRFYVVPHPSGVSRWWNLPENRAKMGEFMRSFVK